MLDIGFTELLLIAVIALVVLGPERLPGAIRTTAYWVGKLRRSFQNAREELERELNVEDIKRQIHNENVMRELEKTKASLQESLNDPVNEHSKEAVDSESSHSEATPASKNSKGHSNNKPSAL
ncbi:Sec-independent protein translocase protein TatB [Endozoicomonas lisbonensis]|uniref:Sec-independent protein translocase protein TatB n=1 Tax=Endozoicomonas lisbonensis TaxID=3120522 RepID=A0ABV2SEQ4_9GAMM